MKKIVFVFTVVFGLIAQSAMADGFGLTNGRSANLDNMADMSVDAGLSFGDFTLYGTRFNFKASPDMLVFADIGLSKLDFGGFSDDPDGLVYGFGVFYQLRDVTLLENTHLAVKGAYHLGTLEASGFSQFGARVTADLDVSEITLDVLISGDQLGQTDFGWYGNVGLHILDADGPGGDTSETEPLFGGGIVGPLPFGEFFAGIDFIDGALFVGGVRYNL